MGIVGERSALIRKTLEEWVRFWESGGVCDLKWVLEDWAESNRLYEKIINENKKQRIGDKKTMLRYRIMQGFTLCYEEPSCNEILTDYFNIPLTRRNIYRVEGLDSDGVWKQI